jgi:endonuclease-3
VFVAHTQVRRRARRLGFSRQTSRVKVEIDLMEIIPRGRRALAAHQLIFHGRQICHARKPQCEICPVLSLCPRIGVA